MWLVALIEYQYIIAAARHWRGSAYLRSNLQLLLDLSHGDVAQHRDDLLGVLDHNSTRRDVRVRHPPPSLGLVVSPLLGVQFQLQQQCA